MPGKEKDCHLPHFHGLLTWARGLKGIFSYPQTHWVLSCPEGTSQKQSCCSELVWGRAPSLLFGFGFFCRCDVIILRGLRRRVLQENKTGRRDLNVKCKNKQIWFFLSSLPLFLWKELSSWLYTTGISLIEKESKRSRVISFQFLLSSSQK